MKFNLVKEFLNQKDVLILISACEICISFNQKKLKEEREFIKVEVVNEMLDEICCYEQLQKKLDKLYKNEKWQK